jgi:hypothetical protein
VLIFERFREDPRSGKVGCAKKLHDDHNAAISLDDNLFILFDESACARIGKLLCKKELNLRCVCQESFRKLSKAPRESVAGFNRGDNDGEIDVFVI